MEGASLCCTQFPIVVAETISWATATGEVSRHLGGFLKQPETAQKHVSQ